jgi:cysteine desulfurase
MRRVYLDNNATTPILPDIPAAMQPLFQRTFWQCFFDSSSWTRDARPWSSTRIVAALLGCKASEIVFTSGGTEGDNLAISGTVSAEQHVITSTIEHHAVLNSCKHWEASGCQVTYIPVDGRGQVDPDDVRRAIRPNTCLITIRMANNETGVLQPVEESGKLAAEADCIYRRDTGRRQSCH